jgi:hypothetical protein
LAQGKGREWTEKRVSSKIPGKNKVMACLKHTMRKGKPLGEGKPESSRKLTRIENVAREAVRMYQTSVPQKGKEVVESWEEEIKVERGSKEMDKIAQEVDWIRDMGVTRTRETLYHRTLEMAWVTKMLIGKVKADRDETRREEQLEMKSLLEDIQRRVSGLETMFKMLVDIEKNQQSKLERLAAQFHLFLRFVHHLDITPADDSGAPTQIRRTRTTSPKEDNKDQAGRVMEHPQVL